jgi:hypothetical protein
MSRFEELCDEYQASIVETNNDVDLDTLDLYNKFVDVRDVYNELKKRELL